jgi:hypothetical protein
MKRVPLILFWILTAAVVCSAQGTFYYPHVANGLLNGQSIWKTTIFLTNPASSGTASGTITFTQDNSTSASAGSAFNISFTDQTGAPANSSGNGINFSIPGGQTRKYISAGNTPYGGGFATVVTTVGTVSGTAVFSEFDLSNRLIAEAGVPSVPAVAKQAIFVDTVGGFNIGVAYANPGTSAANVTLSLLNASAVSVASTTQTLGPGNHAASFTSQIFPSAAQLTGTMQISSTTPLAAIALRFDPTFSVFTTLPPVTLSSLIYPAIEWLEQRALLTPLTSVARLLGAFQLRFG